MTSLLWLDTYSVRMQTYIQQGTTFLHSFYCPQQVDINGHLKRILIVFFYSLSQAVNFHISKRHCGTAE